VLSGHWQRKSSQYSNQKIQNVSKNMATNDYRGIYAIKPWWQRRLTSIENILVARHIHPDIITLAGVGCAVLMAVSLAAAAARPWLTLLIAPLAIARLAANALDGLVARRTGFARPWGEVFNECCDRLADTLVFAGLACNPLVNASLAWVALVFILLNSYLGTVAKAAGGKRQFGGLLAKADRMIYMALFSCVPLFYGSAAWNRLLLAFIPATLLTIVQRYRWAYADLHQA
jgi:CDP-diacylglycerol--glycerol-3-phosphate 3-phosphatidyltransferase